MQVELNEFKLGIDRENMLYRHAIYSMGTIYTVPNTPAASTVWETLKFGNNSLAIPTPNPRKRARAKSDSSFGFYFFSFYLFKEKKLEAIITEASFAKAGDNAAAGEDAGGNDVDDNTEDNAENENAIGRDNRDNIAGAGEKATASGNATTKDAAARNAATRMGNDAKNTKGGQDKDGAPEKKKRKCRCPATVEKAWWEEIEEKKDLKYSEA